MTEIRWIYFGVFLNEVSKIHNLKALQNNGIVIPDDWKMFNHHMTIAFNDGSERNQELYDAYSSFFGTTKKLTIDGIGISDDAIAIRVNYGNVLPIANKIPHITIATPPNGKPVNSNKITKWIDIEPYTVYGKLGHFAK